MFKASIQCEPVNGVTTGLRLLGAVGRTDWRQERLDNFVTLAWFAKWQVNEKVALHLRVENLNNAKYSMTNDYDFGPRLARGAAIYGGVTVEF